MSMVYMMSVSSIEFYALVLLLIISTHTLIRGLELLGSGGFGGISR
jgi:hypothetical protein